MGTIVGTTLRTGSVGANVCVATGGTVSRAVSGEDGGSGNMKDEAANTNAPPINATATTVATSVRWCASRRETPGAGVPHTRADVTRTGDRRAPLGTSRVGPPPTAAVRKRPEQLDESRRSAEFGGAVGQSRTCRPADGIASSAHQQVRVDQPTGGVIRLRATQGARPTYKAPGHEKVAASGRRRSPNSARGRILPAERGPPVPVRQRPRTAPCSACCARSRRAPGRCAHSRPASTQAPRDRSTPRRSRRARRQAPAQDLVPRSRWLL